MIADQQHAAHDAIRLDSRARLRVDPLQQAQLQALMQPDGARFMRWVALHLAVWGAAAALIVLADSPWLQGLATLVLGSQLHAFTVLQHDCGHQSAFRSAAWNLWVGRLLAWFIVFPFSSFTECHKRHHRYLGDPQQDPDDWNYLAGVRWMFLRIALFVPRFTYFSLVRYGHAVRNRVVRELVFNVASMGLLCAIFVAFERLDAFLLIFAAPLLLLALVINPISRGYEHFPMATLPAEQDERLDLSRNTITVTSRVVGLLWANINYHVEHHVYPNVPFFNLPKLHGLLAHQSFQRDRWLLERLFSDPLAQPATPTAVDGRST